MIYFDERKHGFSSSFLTKYSVTGVFGERLLTRDNFSSRKITVEPTQVHGDTVAVVDTSDKSLVADGLITTKRGLPLSIITADCVPLILFDPEKKIVGLSHQGWRGLKESLPQKMVNTMTSLGSKKEAIIAVIGPSINECCYEVSSSLYNDFSSAFPDFLASFVKRSGKYWMNLQRLTYLQLADAGISPMLIDHFPFCTNCDKNRFFSYRRGDTNERMLSYIQIHR